jgi:hypothetical protein
VESDGGHLVTRHDGRVMSMYVVTWHKRWFPAVVRLVYRAYAAGLSARWAGRLEDVAYFLGHR